MFYVFS